MQSTLQGINYTCNFVYQFGFFSPFCLLCVDRYPVLTENVQIIPKMPKIQGCFDLKKPHVFLCGENKDKMLGQWLGLNASSRHFSRVSVRSQKH